MGLARPGVRAPGKTRPGTLAQQQPLTFSSVQAAAPRLTPRAARGRTATSSSRWRVPKTRRSPPPAISACLGPGYPGRQRSRARERASFAFPLLHPWVDCARLPIAGRSPPHCAAQAESAALLPHDLQPRAGLSWEAQASEPKRTETTTSLCWRGRKEERGISMISNVKTRK